ncbi:MAG: hypothetical protein Pars2KO_01400 [Parasphingorhabdus sp.]
MTHSHKAKFKSLLSTDAVTFSLALALTMVAPQEARASECLLDSNNNGTADAADTDAGIALRGNELSSFGASGGCSNG